MIYLKTDCFTYREIDIIACLICGRSTKKIASFLFLSPRTVENHIRNVMIKLQCSSRERIVDFIEESGMLSFMRQHYSNLLKNFTFEKFLKKAITLLPPRLSAYIVYSQAQNDYLSFINRLDKHLKMLSFNTIHFQNSPPKKTPINLLNDLKMQTNNRIIYILSKDVAIENQRGKLISNIMEAELDGKLPINNNSIIFISLDKEPVPCIEQASASINHVNFSKDEEYCYSFFELIKMLFPSINFNRLALDFKEQYESIHQDFGGNDVYTKLKNKNRPFVTDFLMNLFASTLKRKNRKNSFIKGFIIFLIAFSFVSIVYKTTVDQKSKQNTSVESISVRSDLLIPNGGVLLRRAGLLAEIEKKFTERDKIQIVSIVGIGGAGKTTLARQFARDQKSAIIWEINSETKNSLLASFEALAYKLSKTPEQKKDLAVICEIKDFSERETKLLVFVKEQLKTYQDWLLIYDNVDSLSDVVSFFPLDENTWGNGKVLITTRDVNIANSSYINSKNIINIGELNEAEKLILFDKISNVSSEARMPFQEKEKIKTFLKDIPPFPLDVSVTAYYLKDTKISYDEYLKLLSAADSNFSKLQGTILKDMGEYDSTRYNIITLSLEKLISVGNDYKDLLLMITLLDSQDIPKDLLIAFKGHNVVDLLIHDLKKNSLITEKKPKNISETFSIHRSTQSIFFSHFLKTLNYNKQRDRASSITKILEDYLIDVINDGDFAKMRSMVNHSVMFLNHKELLDDSMVGDIEVELGRIYFYLGDYIKAKKFLEQSIVKLQKVTEDKRNKIAKALVHLGDVNRSLSNYKESQKNLEEGLRIYTPLAEKGDPQIAWNLVLLGNVYRELGQFKDAQAVIEKGLEIYKKDRNLFKAKIGWALVHLGDVYRSIGNYEKAKSFYEESVNIHKEVYGSEHIKTAWALVYLGIIYEDLGKYEEARSVLQQSIKIYEANFGENHVGTAWALVRLGIAYKYLNNYKQAVEVLKRSFKIHQQYYGDEHVRTAWVLTYLGDTYKDLGNNEEALSILTKSLNIHKKYFGENHIKISWISISIANVYINLQEYEQSETLLKQALTAYEKHYGSNHVETARVLQYLGHLYLKQGLLEEAEVQTKRALSIFLNEKHSESFFALENMAELYLQKHLLANKRGDKEQSSIFKIEADNYLKKALGVAEQNFSIDSPYRRRILFKLSALET